MILLNMMYPRDVTYYERLAQFIDYEPMASVDPYLRGLMASSGQGQALRARRPPSADPRESGAGSAEEGRRFTICMQQGHYRLERQTYDADKAVAQFRRHFSKSLREDAVIGDISHEEYTAIAEEITAQNDRGAAVVAAAFVDELLSRSIRSKFIPLSTSKAKALFAGSGPLATYDARINIAYALDLLNDLMVADLKIIGIIRNKFAHRVRSIYFSDTEVKELCTNLKHGRSESPEAWLNEPRNQYIRACMFLIAVFSIAELDRIEAETAALERSLAARAALK